MPAGFGAFGFVAPVSLLPRAHRQIGASWSSLLGACWAVARRDVIGVFSKKVCKAIRVAVDGVIGREAA